MPVYSIWETWLKQERIDLGLAITKQIWIDMRGFTGYEGHMLLRDHNDPSHLLLISLWKTQQDADKTLELYKDHPNVKALQPFLAKERIRTLYHLEEINGVLLSD